MTKILSDAQDAQYHDEGFLAPLGLVSEADADQLYRNFQSLEQNCEGDVSQRFRIKAHLPFPWLCETRFDGATAMVLRGTKTAGNWLPDPELRQDFDPDCIEMMDITLARIRASTDAKIGAGGKT
jgi:hypothetical protein